MHVVHIANVDLRGLDLNLVLALHALLTERHVTRAAKRLGLTQSATSHALARLRTKLRDPLLVRTGKGMVPSQRAQAMLAPLEQALADIATILAVPAPFDPARAKVRFTLATSDYVELVLLPKLLARMWAEAPGIDVRAVTLAGSMVSALSEGVVDLIIGFPRQEREPVATDVPRGLLVKRLFRERFVCVMRKGHPQARKKLDVDTFAALPHALVSPGGAAGSIVDTLLEKLGKRRRVAIEIPHFLVAPHIVRETDVVLTLAERVAMTLASRLDLVMVKPPIDIPTFTMSMLWHERARADPAHAWLRARVAEVAKEV